MAQGNTVLPTTGTISGLAEQEYINAALDALQTGNIGGAAPANGTGGVAVQGQFWWDTSVSGIMTLRQYDGAAWNEILSVNTATHAVAIPNASLANASMTIAGHAIALGGTQTIAAADLSNGVSGSGEIALVNSPALTGTPTAPTQAATDNSDAIATTAFAQSLLSSTFPTRTILSSGSGTYNTPANCKRIAVRMVAGGGASGGLGVGATNGGDGTSSTFGPVSVNPGHGGGGNNSSNGGVGTPSSGNGTGSASGLVRVQGSSGMAGPTNLGGSVYLVGSPGAGTPFGSGSFATGVNIGGLTPTTPGAGACGTSTASTDGGSGSGGAGEYAEFYIDNPAATYSYSVGVGGTAGTGGYYSGGNGGPGLIIVDEYYS